MVILIAGASHTGKTLLAQRLLERTRYPYLSVDHLKMGLIRSGQTKLTPMDDDALTAYLWPIVREIVKTALENRQNLIVEGCYFPFDWRKDFDERELAEVRFVCLTMTEGYIDAHFDEIRAHASEIEARVDDTYCTAAWLKAENRAVRKGFRACGEPVWTIETDYRASLGALTDRLCLGIPAARTANGAEHPDPAPEREAGAS